MRVTDPPEPGARRQLPLYVTNRATRTQDLQGVIDASMCIGCGACMSVDPTLKVELDPQKLIYQPSHASGADAASVCPAVRVDFAGLQETIFPGAEQTPYGVVHSVLLAQSTDYPRNLKASSGGLVKELLLHYLRRDDVDGALALGHVGGIDFQTRLVTRPEQVDELPGSIYHNLQQSRALELLHELEGRYVLVAIPCQLEGIYSYIHQRAPHLAGRIHTTIGLLCGWQYSHHALRAVAQFKGIDYQAITDLSFRGDGPVGKLKIWTGETVHTAGRRVDFDYQVAFDRSFNTPRCHTCVNHSNYLADIVVGDAWLPSTVTTRTGVSLLICRTPGTDQAVRALARDGAVMLSEVSTAEIMESQKRRVVFGDFAYAYSAYLDEIGVHHPDMVGPNRPEARLAPRRDVARFHRELTRKLELQWARRYRYLRLRKATVELPRHLKKYLDWFFVRVLRVKSLTGQRREVPRDQLRDFR
jgi:coenzyme F420-reducing hydrogenase beta subunit